ncbi:toxin-antitoxin system HicB family antitoxin [Ruoffia tabacinasalis]
MQPSLHKKVTVLADAYGLSFNEFVHQILEKITESK